MLFKKDIEPGSPYRPHCPHREADSILSKKKWVVHSGGHCRSFRYDPLLRVPPPPATLDLSRLKDEDFSL